MSLRPAVSGFVRPRWKSLRSGPSAGCFERSLASRRASIGSELLQAQHVAVPVWWSGNVTVGGTGKTPWPAWLAPAACGCVVIGSVSCSAATVDARSTRPVGHGGQRPADVGDEAVLHALRRPQAVVVGADRVAAARRAAEQGAEIIVCDARPAAPAPRPGRRDRRRGCRARPGNRLMLPAGPLREPPRTAERVKCRGVTQRGEP